MASGALLKISPTDKLAEFLSDKLTSLDGSVIFNINSIAGIQTLDLSAVGGGGGLSDIQWGNTLIVDADLGNDGSAVFNSIAFRYSTIDAAMAAALVVGNPLNNIIVLPGNYTMSVPFLPIPDLTITCYPGVNINGANLFSDIESGFKLVGYADIYDDDDLFAGVNLAGKLNIFIQCNSITCSSLELSGSSSLIMEMFSYLDFYGSGINLTDTNKNIFLLTVPKIIGEGTKGTPSLITLFKCKTDSNITINANVEISSANKYEHIINVIGDGIQDFFFEFNGNLYLKDLLTLGTSVIYAENNAPDSTKPETYTCSINSKVFFNNNTIGIHAFGGGFLKFSGELNISDNSTKNAIQLDRDTAGFNAPSIVLLQDTDIDYQGTNTNVCYYNNAGGGGGTETCKLQVKNVKCKSTSATNFINSQVASAKYQVLSAYTTVGEGANITNEIAPSTLIVAANMI